MRAGGYDALGVTAPSNTSTSTAAGGSGAAADSASVAGDDDESTLARMPGLHMAIEKARRESALAVSSAGADAGTSARARALGPSRRASQVAMAATAIAADGDDNTALAEGEGRAVEMEAEEGEDVGTSVGLSDSVAGENFGEGRDEGGLQLLITEQDLLDAAERAHIYVTDAADLW